MESLDRLRYAPVGQCIYCGSTQDLTNEHILPFGLSGTAILPSSSCQKCASITGAIEQKVLRGPMWAVRVYRKLASRTKHKHAPYHYPLTVVKNGKEIQLEVPIDDFPILLFFPIFTPPAFLNPAGYIQGIHATGVRTISFGPRPEEIARKLDVEGINLTQTLEPPVFARMIAKIAYAWAAADDKLRLLKESSFVVPAILGRADDIGRWVGTITEPVQKHDGILHRISIHDDRYPNLLIAEVHLFSDSETPRYEVILGELA